MPQLHSWQETLTFQVKHMRVFKTPHLCLASWELWYPLTPVKTKWGGTIIECKKVWQHRIQRCENGREYWSGVQEVHTYNIGNKQVSWHWPLNLSVKLWSMDYVCTTELLIHSDTTCWATTDTVYSYRLVVISMIIYSTQSRMTISGMLRHGSLSITWQICHTWRTNANRIYGYIDASTIVPSSCSYSP